MMNLIFAAFTAIALLLFSGLVWRHQRQRARFDWWWALGMALLIGYLLIVGALTLLPVTRMPARVRVDWRLEDMLTQRPRQIWGNVAMCMPLPVLAAWLSPRWQRLTSSLALSFCFSLAIECLQLVQGIAGWGGRVFDVNDLVLNTLGGGLGFVVVAIWFRHQKNDPHR